MSLTKSCYLDASFIVALLVENHPLAKKAKAIAHQIQHHRLVISLLVMDEVLYVFYKYGYEREQIQSVLSDFLWQTDQLELIGSPGGLEQALSYLNTWRTSRLMPRDAQHWWLMQTHQIDYLATLDEDFSRVGVELVRKQ